MNKRGYSTSLKKQVCKVYRGVMQPNIQSRLNARQAGEKKDYGELVRQVGGRCLDDRQTGETGMINIIMKHAKPLAKQSD